MTQSDVASAIVLQRWWRGILVYVL